MGNLGKRRGKCRERIYEISGEKQGPYPAKCINYPKAQHPTRLQPRVLYAVRLSINFEFNRDIFREEMVPKNYIPLNIS